MTTPPKVPTRVFSLDDQKSFAQLAGDWNPIHLDPLAARRSPFGRVIVHGIHTLLWALDSQVPEAVAIAKLTATFPKPAYVGEPVVLEIEQVADLSFEFVAHSGSNQVLKASVDYVPDEVPASVSDAVWPESQPEDLDTPALVDVTGELPLQLEASRARSLFPNLTEHLRASDLALVVTTSRIVGMHCPGLYSLFSSLKVGPGDGPADRVRFALDDFDDRFARCRISATTAQRQADISAFLRPRPTEQATIADVVATVDASRFDSTRALIIGGSRGLGEVTAKVLAAGGAEVAITYNQGRADADALVGEINDAGGNATAVQLDVTDETSPLPMPFDEAPTEVFYFATPPIFVGSRTSESKELLDRFVTFYCTAFERIVEFYFVAGTDGFYAPSSVAVDDPPPDMREYAEAKRQQEEWSESAVVASGGNLRIMTSRLPRVATDQTASNMPVDNADALTLMLSELDSFLPA